MNTIWKWKLELQTGNQITLDMPQYAEVLTLQRQRDDLCLWAAVDTTAPICKRTFTIYGTGHPMPDDTGMYIGTFQEADGSLVFHVFEQELG
jgi:hypothetical protein